MNATHSVAEVFPAKNVVYNYLLTLFQKLARTAKATPVKSAKARIAGALGIISPPAGSSIPRLKGERSVEGRKAELGSSFSIFGHKEELIHFEELVQVLHEKNCSYS